MNQLSDRYRCGDFSRDEGRRTQAEPHPEVSDDLRLPRAAAADRGSSRAALLIRRCVTMGMITLIFASVFPCGGSPAFGQTVLYVDQNATGPVHDGWTWCTAFTELQDALDTAVWNVVIRVADGTYTPYRGTADRAVTFRLTSMVRLEGGYAGCGAANPDERDVGLYETILSGDLNGDDTGALDDPSRDENSYHVVTASGTDQTAILDGFTLTAGKADGTGTHNYGGGMYNHGDTTVSNCVFTGNSGNDGGGMYLRGHPTISDCVFLDNLASLGGGGLYSSNGNPAISGCTFIANSAATGGAAYLDCSDSTIHDCIFSGNSAEGNGGAVYVYDCSDPTMTTCVFLNNAAGQNGGGIYVISASDLTLSTCIFSGNSAVDKGGGLYFAGGCDGTLANCTFSHNTALEGQGMGSESSTNVFVRSCILWDGANELYGSFSRFTISFSNVYGGWPGDGNIFAIPEFVDADGLDDIPGTEDDDLRLLPESPCINTGDPELAPDPEDTDLDGNPRVVGGYVDMGAYESTTGCSGSDFDEDGVPDMCDPDIDDDGLRNDVDICDFTPVGAVILPDGGMLADLDGDCDSDLADFALFQNDLSGP